MFVDEPKGNDRGYDSEETGYDPTHIMHYKECFAFPIISSVREPRANNDMTITYLEIRPYRVEREKVFHQVPLA
jgi:hypothetical protein